MKILASCKISDQGIYLNGEVQQKYTKETDNWKKDVYSKMKLDYPKFYKMDALAKMAFLGFELMESVSSFEHFEDNDVALLFANRNSSYDTDLRFIESYTEKGSPGPSLFVYTLPNILTGELAIRKKWFGENIFFIQENFDPEFFIDQINFYFRKGSKACLCGWVDSANDKEECFLFVVEKTDGEITAEELKKYYKQ
jgi:hypothetical protein